MSRLEELARPVLSAYRQQLGEDRITAELYRSLTQAVAYGQTISKQPVLRDDASLDAVRALAGVERTGA